MQNVFTIDVEEHFQVHAFETVIDRATWDSYPSRVVANTQRILDLLAESDTHATFFVLGWVADRHPALVQAIVDGGHELATHGYWHELVYRQTPEEFAADLQQSLAAIERAVGNVPVAGYRAPGFSITNESLWALDVLREHGLAYDSSIFPLSMHDRYGLKEAPRFANKVRGDLWEFPVNTLRLGNFNLPIAGGGYFRLYPLWTTRQAIRHLNSQERPAVIYLHPWEFDPEQPRVTNAPRLSRFRHTVNLHKTEDRVRTLLSEFKFGTMREGFADLLGTS